MTTTTLILLILTFISVAATLRALGDGGRGRPPSSHERDDRFRPPSSLVH